MIDTDLRPNDLTPHPALPAASGGRDAVTAVAASSSNTSVEAPASPRPSPRASGGEGEAQCGRETSECRTGGGQKRLSSSRNDARTPRARSLRKRMTLEERIVWSQLKRLDIEGHFRRQAPIGPYFADFAHLGLRLIVEIDGAQHNLPSGILRDAARTAYLDAAGFQVLRFWNNEIRDNRDGVIETILTALSLRPSLSTDTPHPLSLPAINGGRDASWTR